MARGITSGGVELGLASALATSKARPLQVFYCHLDQHSEIERPLLRLESISYLEAILSFHEAQVDVPPTCHDVPSLLPKSEGAVSKEQVVLA
jgi:hypothetical protein